MMRYNILDLVRHGSDKDGSDSGGSDEEFDDSKNLYCIFRFKNVEVFIFYEMWALKL